MAVPELPPSRLSFRQQHSRSRAKERQRRTQEADEMLEYFGNGEAPTTTTTGAPREQPCDDFENPWSNDLTGPDCFDSWHETKQMSPGNLKRDKGSFKSKMVQGQTEPGSKASSHHRPSSRATSYMTWSTSNNQPSMKYELMNRDPSSTPEPVREALRQTGVFDGTGLLGKDRLSQTGALPSDEPRGPAEDVLVHTSEGERRRSTSRNDAVRRVDIIRYQDKGIMTADDLPPKQPAQLNCQAMQDHPDNLKEFGPVGKQLPKVKMTSKSTSTSTVTDDETRMRAEVGYKGASAQQPGKRPASRAQIAVQAYVGPQTKEISTQTSPAPQLNAPNQTAQPELAVSIGRETTNNGASTTRMIGPHAEDLLAVRNTGEGRLRFEGEHRSNASPIGRVAPVLYNDANSLNPHFDRPSNRGGVSGFRDAFPDYRIAIHSRDKNNYEGEADTFYSAPESRSRKQLLDESYPNYRARAQNPIGRDGISQLQSPGGFIDVISRFEKDVAAREGEDHRSKTPLYMRAAFEPSAKYSEPPYEEGYHWQSGSTPMVVATPQKLNRETWHSSELAGPGVVKPGLASTLDSPWEPEQREVHISQPWESQAPHQFEDNEQEERHTFWEPNFLYY